MEQIIQILLSEWQERTLPNIIRRDYDPGKIIERLPGKVLALTGFRRVGKTFLVLDCIKDLLTTHNRKEVVYLNLEDERIPSQTEFLSSLIPAIQKITGITPKFLFLDEIQNIPNWSKWVRRIFETTETRIIITGSSSKLSMTEIPTELRGRYWELFISPLSFNEFLRFNQYSPDREASLWNTEIQNKLNHYLDQYITWGGLPEIVLTSEPLRTELVQNYYRTVVYKDITEHFDLRNPELLKALIRLLLNHSTITISQLHRILSSSGIESSKNTIANYLEFVQSSFFVKLLTRFSFKFKEELLFPRKVYCIDNAFLHALSTGTTKDRGALFENAIFHALDSAGFYLNYYKSGNNKQEIDFISSLDSRVMFAVQASVDLTDHRTMEREVRALINSSTELNCNNLIIINKEVDKTENIDWFGKTAGIRFIPAWKFLLNPSQITRL
jgi:predicted AAA+ superfamily ATPase